MKESYTWNSKDCLRKFLVLGLISTFKNVTKYNINIEKSIAFLYTNNELTKKETRDFGNPITIPLKTMPSNKPNQGSGRLFLRNFRTLKEDAKEDTRNTRRQKHPPYLYWKNQHRENGSSLKSVFRFNAIPIKNYGEILQRDRKIQF